MHDLHPLEDSQLPRSPEIAIEALRQLLADLPGDWHLTADDAAVFVLLDQDD